MGWEASRLHVLPLLPARGSHRDLIPPLFYILDFPGSCSAVCQWREQTRRSLIDRTAREHGLGLKFQESRVYCVLTSMQWMHKTAPLRLISNDTLGYQCDLECWCGPGIIIMYRWPKQSTSSEIWHASLRGLKKKIPPRVKVKTKAYTSKVDSNTSNTHPNLKRNPVTDRLRCLPF